VINNWRWILRLREIAALLSLLILMAACATPVRPAYKVNESLPVGSIQGDSFVGERYPFRIKIPEGWRATTKYPEFLVEQGYGLEGLKATPFFLFNPITQSSLQIDFSPAKRTARFDQGVIEAITKMAGGCLLSDLEEEYGKNFHVQLSRVEPVRLKGVPYAARMSARYAVKGQMREQGWIYAFAEPYQLFFSYLLPEMGGKTDKDPIEHVLATFEYLGTQ
jgi:hypothetical protein